MTEPEAMRILGLTTATTEDEIKRAWRRVVKQTHPDLHPHDPQAAVRFQRVQEAYDLLRAQVAFRPVSATASAVGPSSVWDTYRPEARDVSNNPVQRQPGYDHPRPGYPHPAPVPPERTMPPRKRWDAQRGSLKWWVYSVAWKLTSVPFIAILALGISNHQSAVAVQDQFRNAPRCAAGGGGGCVQEAQGDVVSEDCSICRSAADVRPTSAVTVDVDGIRYLVTVVVPDQPAQNAVFAFDHGSGSSKVAVDSWGGDIVSVAGLRTTANPLQHNDDWGVLSAVMLLPIGWTLLAPARLVDFTFRVVGILVMYVVRLIAMSLFRV